jgi:HAMP domain-containing protein
MLEDKLKTIIAWVGLGASLVVYAHANFAAREDLEKNTERLDRVATSDDMKRLEAKVDGITLYLLNNK